jgi:hypothetical protein
LPSYRPETHRVNQYSDLHFLTAFPDSYICAIDDPTRSITAHPENVRFPEPEFIFRQQQKTATPQSAGSGYTIHNYTMKVTHHSVTHPLALFPASLLKDGRQQHQLTTQHSPSRYMLVFRRNNPKQTRLMRQLSNSLQERGIKVSMLSL